MKKIKAYTILEITIAMIISGICMATAYTVYQLVGNSFKQYDAKNEAIAESLQLDKLLTRDFLNALRVNATEGGFRIHRKNDDVDYVFTGESVIRTEQDMQVDTFLIPIGGRALYFQGRATQEDGLVDKVVFSTVLNGDSSSQCYAKQYSAEELVNSIQ